jgi:hypothetical protein
MFKIMVGNDAAGCCGEPWMLVCTVGGFAASVWARIFVFSGVCRSLLVFFFLWGFFFYCACLRRTENKVSGRQFAVPVSH